MDRSLRLGLALGVSMIAACRADGIVLEQPVGQTHRTTSATGGAQPLGTDDPAASIGVTLDEPLRLACQIQEPGEPPRFEVDDARLRPVGDDVFAAVARCLATKPGASLVVVGHSDPRGEDEYSQKLGMLRAHRARAALVANGVRIERIAIGSRGARDATGTDEATWAGDRRVVLYLARPRALSGMAMPSFAPRPKVTASATAAKPIPAAPVVRNRRSVIPTTKSK